MAAAQAQKLRDALSLRLQQQCSECDSNSTNSSIGTSLEELVKYIETTWGVCLV